MERQPTTDRMIQEYVPGKQVTLAHLIANPGKDLFKKLGLQDAVSAIGILTITPSEASIIACDIATKSGAVEIGFLDRFTGAVVLTGAGRSFSAGADLDWMRRMAEHSQEDNLADAAKLARLMHLLARLPKPTLALVQGAAYGGGVGLACCCDVVLAADTARFCLSEVRLGLTPATISP